MVSFFYFMDYIILCLNFLFISIIFQLLTFLMYQFDVPV
ncbi:hypothetical protein LSO9J_40082 [Candidatus Liberibacter solanacearum]